MANQIAEAEFFVHIDQLQGFCAIDIGVPDCLPVLKRASSRTTVPLTATAWAS